MAATFLKAYLTFLIVDACAVPLPELTLKPLLPI